MLINSYLKLFIFLYKIYIYGFIRVKGVLSAYISNFSVTLLMHPARNIHRISITDSVHKKIYCVNNLGLS